MLRLNLIGVDRRWSSSIDGHESDKDLWNSINWSKAKRVVCRLQKRIVKAVKAGDKPDILEGLENRKRPNRRSHRKSFNWKKVKRMLGFCGVPKPKVLEKRRLHQVALR